MTKLKRLNVGDPAPQGICLNVDGLPVELDSLWAEGPLFLTFLRHFGCIHCREWLAQLELQHEEIEAAGLRIVAIGLGEPKHAQRYGSKLAPSVVCLTREEPDLYDEFGIGKGNVLRMIAPDAIVAGAKAASKGFTQGKSTGDTTRLIATFVVDQAGIVRYAHYGKHAGDHVDIDTLLATWQSLKVSE